MVLLHDIIEIFAFADRDGCPMLGIVADDSGGICPDRRNGTGEAINLTDAVIGTIGNKQITLGINKDTSRIIKLRSRSRTTITAKATLAGASDGGDGARGGINLAE